MSQIDMYIAENDVKIDAGEALGFFGLNGFGDPLSLNEFNGRTFITNSSGTVSYEECDNCKRISSSGVIVGQTGNGINLINLPNYLTTVNVRFTHPQSVLVQNVKLIAFDGVSELNDPVGINIYAADIIHTSRFQSTTGTGDSVWTKIAGSGQQLNMIDSPGTSGLSPLGPATSDIRHDWYIPISVSPTTPSAKTFSLRIDLEFI